MRADRRATGRSALSGPPSALRPGAASRRAISCGKQVAIDELGEAVSEVEVETVGERMKRRKRRRLYMALSEERELRRGAELE